MVWERIGKARERSGCSIKDLVFARGESLYNEFCDDPKQQKMESGEGDYSPNSTVSFGYNLRACDVMHIVSVADALKCSVDYLLGRTDDRQSHLDFSAQEPPVSYSGTEPKPEKVPYQGTGWQIGDPTEEGRYILLVRYDANAPTCLEEWDWDNDHGWQDGAQLLDEDFVEVLGWIPFPKLPGTEVDG